MVDQLSSFADEVTRVAREVGTEGKLGGQAQVKGVSGTWKDLTDNVNVIAVEPHRTRCATSPRSPPRSPTGDLSQKITRRRTGEILELKNTDQHDGRPARARSPTRSRASRARSAPRASSAARRTSTGVAASWHDLTDNVNLLAGTLTTQLRAIADVSTAVTQGDLTRSITVEAQGEVDAAQGQHQPDDRQPARHDRRQRRSRTG